MQDRPLATLDEAAHELGVPKMSLRNAAETHGLLVRMGRALRIERASYPELIEACRKKPREPACISGRQVSGTSAIPAATTYRPAREVAEMLKSRSPTTSPRAEGQLVPLQRKK